MQWIEGGIKLKDPEKMKMLAKEHLLASDRYLKKNLFDSAVKNTRCEEGWSRQSLHLGLWRPIKAFWRSLCGTIFARAGTQSPAASSYDNLKPAVSQSETAQPASKEELLTTTVLNLKAASQSETAQSAIKEELLTTTVINLKAAASQSETVQAAIKENCSQKPL